MCEAVSGFESGVEPPHSRRFAKLGRATSVAERVDSGASALMSKVR